MKQKKETTTQPGITDQQRTEIERGLRMAKEYWLQTVQRYIAGRILPDVEFFAAIRAHGYLHDAVTKACDWNRACAAVKDSTRKPVSVDVDLSAESFRQPETPRMFFADNVKPEVLAATAAPLVTKQAENLSPVEAVRKAHELLMAVERHIGTLPKQIKGSEIFVRDLEFGKSMVTFADIEASNRPGRLPLLLPVAQKKKSIPATELAEKPLSLPAIKKAVRCFLTEHKPTPTQADVDLQGNRISFDALCTLRWERFKKSSRVQQSRAAAREAKKEASKETKTGIPKSATLRQGVTGKRRQ
jgi:hypothetical protein